MKRKLAIVFFVALIALILPMLSFAAVNIGDSAPDFSLVDLGGKSVNLSLLRGNVVLLNIWGTFCQPCIAELPSLNRLYLDLKDKGFVVVGLAVDSSAGPVKSLVTADRIAYPVVMDPKQEVFSKKYATYVLPVTYLIDRRGVVVQKFFGEEKWDSAEMKQKIAGLLNRK